MRSFSNIRVLSISIKLTQSAYLQAEERLAMIEEQMRIEQEKQKLKKREEKRMREEQKKILGKGNARPKLSFSLIGPADS